MMGFLNGITSFVKEHSNIIHGVLNIAGFIPGMGAVADLANAAVYAAEGDYANAALSVASAVPGIGDTVTLAKKSAKAIKGGAKAMKNMKALTKAEKMKGLFGLLRGKAQTGARKVTGKVKDLKALFRDIKNGDKELCLFGKCFTGDTLVYTKKGYVAIREIQRGDDIYSRDERSGGTGFKEVEEVFRTGAHTIYHIWLEGKEEIKTTAYHPIYVEERGWVTAINLREGDPVQTMEGTACITKIEKERFEEPVPVYNLHVKDWASYFVSYMRIFVHNGTGGHRQGDSGAGFKNRMSPEEAARYDEYWSQGAGSYINVKNPDGTIVEVIITSGKNPSTRQRLQVSPGTKSITDVKYGNNGEMYYRETIFDEYGRRIGNNDYSDHGRPDISSHTNPHHHPNSAKNPSHHGDGVPGLHPNTPK